jgi:hypothetical protein
MPQRFSSSLVLDTSPQNKQLRVKGTTRILYKFNTPDYRELDFMYWTECYLVVKYPSSGKPWRMGRKLVAQWLKVGVLKIEGTIPDQWKDVQSCPIK